MRTGDVWVVCLLPPEIRKDAQVMTTRESVLIYKNDREVAYAQK